MKDLSDQTAAGNGKAGRRKIPLFWLFIAGVTASLFLKVGWLLIASLTPNLGCVQDGNYYYAQYHRGVYQFDCEQNRSRWLIKDLGLSSVLVAGNGHLFYASGRQLLAVDLDSMERKPVYEAEKEDFSEIRLSVEPCDILRVSVFYHRRSAPEEVLIDMASLSILPAAETSDGDKSDGQVIRSFHIGSSEYSVIARKPNEETKETSFDLLRNRTSVLRAGAELEAVFPKEDGAVAILRVRNTVIPDSFFILYLAADADAPRELALPPAVRGIGFDSQRIFFIQKRQSQKDDTSSQEYSLCTMRYSDGKITELIPCDLLDACVFDDAHLYTHSPVRGGRLICYRLSWADDEIAVIP